MALAFLMPIQPNDYGWYVRLGNEIVHSGRLPTIEFMSYTQSGQPAVYQYWLSGVIFWAVREAGGETGTGLLRGLLLAFFYVVLWYLCRANEAGRVISSLFTLLAVLIGGSNWAMRPQLFAYPLFVWVLWMLWAWQKGNSRLLWGLPLAAALWVNLHGSFILLYFLGAAALLAGRGDRKALLFWLGLGLAASMINPRGHLVWPDMLSLVQNPSSQLFSVEWRPPANSGWQMNLFFGWLLVFPLFVGFSKTRLNWLQWLLFLGFGWLALIGVRYVIWFSAILSFLTAGLFQSIIQPKRWIRFRFEMTKVNLIFALLFILLPLPLLPGLRQRWWQQAPPSFSDNTPLGAVSWLKSNPEVSGPLWADLVYSSYLVDALPERPVWVYTRFEQFPPEQWQRYLLIANAEPGWQEALAGDQVNLLMLSKSDQPKLIQGVIKTTEWQLIYEDDISMLFTRLSR